MIPGRSRQEGVGSCPGSEGPEVVAGKVGRYQMRRIIRETEAND